MGLKGSAAADWLERARLRVPAQANSWASIEPDGGPSSWSLVARLGTTEFFIESGSDSAILRNLAQALDGGCDHVYPVLREDRAIVLGGTDPESVLAQVCNVNFASLALESNPVVLTLITGVAAVVVPQREREERRYRIWCDPSFGRYLWNTLRAIVVESGGSELSIEQLLKKEGGQQ
jgi:sarcosine oxidase subunit gamma